MTAIDLCIFLMSYSLVAGFAAVGELLQSPVYESIAVGFSGDNFLNLVVAIETEMTVAALSTLLRDLEEANGRQRNTTKFSSRTLDIDILTYGDTVGDLLLSSTGGLIGSIVAVRWLGPRSET